MAPLALSCDIVSTGHCTSFTCRRQGLGSSQGPPILVLAEAEVREQHSLRQELHQAVVPQLVAELLPLGDGYWEEVARGFVVPPGWPEATRLQALMASLQGSPAI